MVLTKEDKEFILSQFLGMVYLISSKENQQKAWIKGEGSYQVDFDETCNFFFDDYAWLLKAHQKFEISQTQYNILKKFIDEFEAFSDENSWPPLFIETPEWAQIMERAREVLKVFNYQGTDEKGKL